MTKLQATSLILERSTIPQNAVSWGIPGVFEINNKKCGGQDLNYYKNEANPNKPDGEYDYKKYRQQTAKTEGVKDKNNEMLRNAEVTLEKYKGTRLSPKAKSLFDTLKQQETNLRQIDNGVYDVRDNYVKKTNLAVQNSNVCDAYKAHDYLLNGYIRDSEQARIRLRSAVNDFRNEVKAPAICGGETVLTRTAAYRNERQGNEKSIEKAQRVYDTLSKQPLSETDKEIHQELGEQIKKARTSLSQNKLLVEADLKKQDACLPKLADIGSFRQSYAPLIELLMNGRIDNVSLTSKHMEFNAILAGKKIRLSDVKKEYGFDLGKSGDDRYQKIISNAETAVKSGKKSNITQDRIEKTEKLYQDLNRDFNGKSYSSDKLRSRLYIYDTKDKDGRGGYVTIISEKVRELDKRLKFFASELNKLEADLKN